VSQQDAPCPSAADAGEPLGHLSEPSARDSDTDLDPEHDAQDGSASSTHPPEPARPRRRCNELDGRRWLQNSISVWSDIRKTPEEARLGHPAMFPQMLDERLIETFLPPAGELVLDPFAGSGSTLLAAERMGRRGVGLELSAEYVDLAQRRLSALRNGEPRAALHQASASEVLAYVERDSVDLCITSPPYWDILNQRRTADLKAIRHYGNQAGDLGVISDYGEFLNALTAVFGEVLVALRPGAYCCVVVMDLRKKDRFFPLHSDLATRLAGIGYIFDDLIIWNRQSEYNNLRPLGYPSVFRVNKVHEFVLLLRKPLSSASKTSKR
jgi:DNA modification methylase